MAITNFVPELWRAAIAIGYEKATIFSQPTVVNRRFEGEIRQAGDTVHITGIADPTIRTYSKTTDITVEDLSDTDLTLVIDQGDYFAFRVNDVDRVQAAGDFRGPAIRKAGAGLADKLDRYIAGLPYAGALAANKLGRRTVINTDGTPGTGQTKAYSVLVELEEKLNAQGVPMDGRFVIVDSQFVAALQFDNRFLRMDATDTMRTGLVGKIAGFDVLTSGNVRTVNQIDGSTGANQNDKVIVAGVNDAISVAEQIVETEALREQGRFADIVRGLHIYGGKVIEPAGLATATVTYAAPA